MSMHVLATDPLRSGQNTLIRVAQLAFLTTAAVSPIESAAQEPIIIRGIVIDDATAEPIHNALVQIEGHTTIVANLGSFLAKLSPGTWAIHITASGYLEVSIDLAVEDRPLPTLEIRMRRLFLNEEVSVIATGDEETRASALNVRPQDVFDVAGSLDNVFRTLHLLPGVAAPEDYGGRLSVRGGGPDQNLTVMDGIEVHNPYRIFGLISAFNPETVDRFELTAGGFSAAYGDRLSSLLVVDSRAGNPSFGGMATMSITDANLLVEGQLPGKSGNSWLFTARRTYYDLVARQFSDNEFPTFRDFQGRFDLGLGAGTLTIEALTSREDTDLAFDENSKGNRANAFADASNDLVALRYRTPFGTRGSSLTTLSWYRNSDLFDFDGTFRDGALRSNVSSDQGFGFSDVIFSREVFVQDQAARQQFTLPVGSSHLFELGFELHNLVSATSFRSEGDRNAQEANGSSIRGGVGLPDQIDSRLDGLRGGVWVENTIQLTDRTTVVPGLRLDWSTVNDSASLSPRLAVFWYAGKSTRLKLAGGLFTQSPGYEKLQSANYFIDLSDAGVRGIRTQRAVHAIIGLERDMGSGFNFSLEAYYKRFDNLLIGRLESERERLARVQRYEFPEELHGSVPTAPIITSDPSNDGGGSAYGFDLFMVKRPTGPTGVYGWLSYTLGKSQQEAYGYRFPFDYDRRHALSLVANYQLSRRWGLGMTARWSTGFPHTSPVGLRVASAESPAHGASDSDPPALVPAIDPFGNLLYTVNYGNIGNLNRARLPQYARLDARISYRPGGPAGRWEAYLEMLNVLGRENASQLEPSLVYDPNSLQPRIVETPEAALPRIPSFGVRFRF